MTININRIKNMPAHINNEKESIVIKAGGTKGAALSVVVIAETMRRVIPTPVQLPKHTPKRIIRTCSTRIILKLCDNVIPKDRKVPILDLI
jgi:hypothetical protein